LFIVFIREIYQRLRALGVVRTSREFSTLILGQGPNYYRHCCRLDRRDAVPRWVAARVIASLRDIRDAVAPAAAFEIDGILDEAKGADRVARMYYRR
jgi:hypothetical protein